MKKTLMTLALLFPMASFAAAGAGASAEGAVHEGVASQVAQAQQDLLSTALAFTQYGEIAQQENQGAFGYYKAGLGDFRRAKELYGTSVKGLGDADAQELLGEVISAQARLDGHLTELRIDLLVSQEWNDAILFTGGVAGSYEDFKERRRESLERQIREEDASSDGK